MSKKFYPLIFIVIFTLSCKKTDLAPVGQQIVQQRNTPHVTAAEYIDSLLFVPSNNYQIKTSAAATFSSTNPNITISSSGLITYLTSGEIVPVIINWADGSPATTIYALGTTDIDQPQPAAYFHGETATAPYNNYLQGWKLLQRLPAANETYGIILRHADASCGRDWPMIHSETAPDNWWRSPDALLARQLNAQGIKRATDLGQVFKDLNYPIKRVITSEFYRACKTAMLIDAGPQIVTDYRLNHPTHNVYGPGLMNGMLAVMQEQPFDNQMTLIVTHHPANEPPNTTGIYAGYPAVSAFNWSGSFIVKVNADGGINYAGAVTYAMFMYWRDLKLKRL